VNREIAPVAFLVFNRPQHTARVFEAIRAARPRHLLVVADGPRPTRKEDVELCRETRKIVSSPDWPCELLTNFSEENMGCRLRVSSGLDWVFNQFPEAIILEDDCLPVSSFFPFCTTLLDRYRDDTRVMAIAGTNFQLGNTRGIASYYFSHYTHSWGWATWRRAWNRSDVPLASWPAAREEGWLSSVLDDPREVEYWTAVFDRTYCGKIDTWDYQWLFSCWAQSGLTAVANQNLVTNIGVGADATHTKRESRMLGLPTQELGECIHPTTIIRDKIADRFLFEHFISRKPNWVRKVRDTLAIRARAQRLLQWQKPKQVPSP
jgi:hypothetical protein